MYTGHISMKRDDMERFITLPPYVDFRDPNVRDPFGPRYPNKEIIVVDGVEMSKVDYLYDQFKKND